MTELQWILDGLQKPGKTQTGLAKALGRAPSAVTALLQGKRDLKAREISTIARYLEVEPPAQAPIEPRPSIQTAFIVGEVAAGIWREPDLEFEKIPTTVVVDERWPPGAVFLLRVSGTSINRQAKDGDLVLCLDAFAAPRDFQDGDWVIAERVRGGTVEMTVKRVRGSKSAGFLLYPDSDDPRHQTPLPVGKNDGEMVHVRAYVLEFIKKATNF